MNVGKLALATAAAVLATTPGTSSAQNEVGQLKWMGSIYAKFLDGNRRYEEGLYSGVDGVDSEGGGDQGQGIELELKFAAQVSKQVEIGGRIHSRFNKNFWTQYGGFAVPDNNTTNCGEDDPRCNQYIKLRGAWARVTPGYDWMDSLTVGTNDWGMFDPFTQGKSRYIDRDNIGGVLLQGSAMDKTLRWDLARVSLANYLGHAFSTGTIFEDIQANDSNWIAQAKYQPGPDWNATLVAMYVRDKEIEEENPNPLNGVGVRTSYDNSVVGVRGQYSGLGWVDINGALYYSDLNVPEGKCGPGWNDFSCAFSPILRQSAKDEAWFINLNFGKVVVDGLSLSAQIFDIGSDYVSATAARREADVLLTEGQEATWQTGRPDYNIGNRSNRNAMKGTGWAGWSSEVQQVVGSADNDFTDFDEPVAFQVQGWKGVTLVPKLALGDWEFAGEYSYIDFNTNWQACGGTDFNVDCAPYYRNENMGAWGYGGDYRSPFSPYRDRTMEIFTVKANYTLDIGNGIDLMARYKYISDEDNRVTRSSLLTDAYDGFPDAAGVLNPDWIPNVGLGGCVECDDRRADYDTYGFSAGYQLHPDLYAKLIYEYHQVELIDGTVDVAPVGLAFEAGNVGGWANYLTGDTVKQRIALDFSYFLSGIEFGGVFDYYWGEYDPSFYTDSGGKRVKLIPGAGLNTIATPLGNISINDYVYGQYRMKIFMKVNF
jgi:hypothetical protein